MPAHSDAKPSALERLAERYGISSHFENAFGTIVNVSPETITLLLHSMGVRVDDETQATAALAALEQRVAATPMPATIVVTPRDGVCMVAVENLDLPHELDWQLVLETGEEVSGSFTWTDTDAASPAASVLMPLPDIPFGYHRLRLPQLGAHSHLIVTPGQCWLPEKTEAGSWGIAVQLYLVRSATNWGIGDFTDLKTLIEMAGAHGCGLIGLNPLHQMFLDDPENASPYSPATRLYLNPLYIDVTAVPEWAQSQPAQALANSAAFTERLDHCRTAMLVDYAGVTAIKLDALQLIYQTFVESAAPERQAAFAAYCAEQGDSLQSASLFQVLRQHFARTDASHVDWRRWPDELQRAGSEVQHRFADERRAELDFQNWMQFIADEQLSHAADAARGQGMTVGLYRDLAVGCASSGAETWANPAAFLQGNQVGAPPDIFNPAGQNWGLPPFDPVALTREGYRSFAELIRANMRHAGGLRIDHVMGLRRLFCIPEGKHPSEGAYVGFPLNDLLGVLALESHRQQCLVVGEDLGTVPPGFRELLAAANVLSYRVMFFEQDFNTGSFVPPQAYPELAFANTGSHDLPSLLAWWLGEDIAKKESLGLFPDADETTSQYERRARERRHILAAFADAGLFAEAPEPEDFSAPAFAEYAHRFLAMTRSMLLATQLDDMTGEVAPVNLPGTFMEYPNWRRKYRLSLEEIAASPEAWQLVAPLSRLSASTPGQAVGQPTQRHRAPGVAP